jgi:hypothetical protein
LILYAGRTKLTTTEASFLQIVLILVCTKKITRVLQDYFENCISNTKGYLLQTFKITFPTIPHISKWSHSLTIFCNTISPNPNKTTATICFFHFAVTSSPVFCLFNSFNYKQLS